jgi:hypothetical protein
MIPAPQSHPVLPQLLLVEFADLLENLPHTVEVFQLTADLGELGGMKADLASLRPRVIDVEDPLLMAFAIGTGGAGNRLRMEGTAVEK